MAEIIVLVPTKNEEQGIKGTIDDIKDRISPDKIIVVDAHSKDKTIGIAKEQGAEIMLQRGKGKGAGIITFIEETQEYSPDTIVIMVDADSTYGLDNVKTQIPLTERYGMLVGSRFKGKMEKGALTKFNRFGNTVFTLLTSLLFFKKVSDLTSGLRIFRMDALRKMELKVPGFDTETEMTAKCIKRGLGYKEFPCDYYKRSGKTNLHPIKDGWKILTRIIKERFSR